MKRLLIDQTPILNVAVIYEKTSQTILETYIENHFKKSLMGSIWMGKILKISDSMDAAFVNIGQKHNAFIRRKDLLKCLQIDEGLHKSKPLSQIVRAGQAIVAQISKEPYQSKGPLLSSDIAISGKFLVFLPYGKGVKISNKAKNLLLSDKKLLLEQELIEDEGIILRTDTLFNEISIEQIIEELQSLKRKWSVMKHKASVSSVPVVLHEPTYFLDKIYDLYKYHEPDEILVSGDEVYLELLKKGLDKSKTHKSQQHDLLYETYPVGLESLLRDNVFEDSKGVSVTIDELEAMTVIDVNSGRHSFQLSKKALPVEINRMALKKINEMIKLRHISGMMIIDLITLPQDQEKVFLEQVRSQELNTTNGYHVLGITALGLLEVTKKRESPSLVDLLSFSYQKKDLLFLVLNGLYGELRRRSFHTQTKKIRVEVSSELYSFLKQNSIFDSLDMQVELIHSKQTQHNYRLDSVDNKSNV